MRKIAPSLLLLLAACGDRTPDTGAEAQAGAAVMPDAQDPLGAGEDPARLQALVKRAMGNVPGAAGARYRNLRAGVGGAACGEVSLKSAPFRPFVVTPEAIAVIASGPAIAFDDPSDFAADAWIRWCATPEELATIGPRVKEGAAAEPAPGANLSVPAELPPPLPAGPLPPPGEEKAAKPAAPPPPPQIDSFFNSVQRSE